MFVYFTDGTCINDSEIYGVKAKYEQNKYIVEVTIKPTHVLATTPSEPYRVCRRVNILRDYPDDKIKIYP
ncbi:hypothetical protein, partial [Acinetobacter baumannii]|uniref:hypothetical protein n=1 Tax=Acinetobacter baumannii TaxID=470 RepID=UPI003A8AD615